MVDGVRVRNSGKSGSPKRNCNVTTLTT